jgi:hypothetical protein
MTLGTDAVAATLAPTLLVFARPFDLPIFL